MDKILFSIFLTFFLSSCISYQITEKELFYPRKVAKLDSNLKLEEVYFATADSVHLNGWFIKHPNPVGTILYFGGNGFVLWQNYIFDAINIFTSFKMNLLIMDYRGYGRSEGLPTLQGIFEDGISAYKYLCSRSDLDSTKIIIYGHSLGTLVATRIGNSNPVAGVILEGAITNADEMKDAVLKANAPWYLRWLVNINADSNVLSIDNLKQVDQLTCPLLLITGSDDNITPPQMGQKIFDTATSSYKRFEIIPNGTHNNLYFNSDNRRERFKEIVSEFLAHINSHRKDF